MLLNTILYSIAELSKINEKIKEYIKGQKLIIQFSIGEGGPIEFLEIKNDKIFFERKKKFTYHDVRIHFFDLDIFLILLKEIELDFNQLIAEGKIEFDGRTDFKEKLIEIIKIALPYSNNALGEELTHEEEYTQVKIILFAFMSGMQIIADEDENVKKEMKGINVIIQININNGPQCYLLFDDGVFSGAIDVQHPNPTVILTLSDLHTARMLLTGKADGAKMFIKGQIQIEGDYKHAMKLMNLNELLQDYADYIKERRRK